MREVAGVLLIVIAIVNLAGAVMYGLLGGATQVIGSAVEEAAKSEEFKDSPTTSKEQVKASAGVAQLFGGAIRVFALALLILAICEIVAAVFLFQAAKAVFILCVAAVEILIDVALLIMLSFSGPIMPLTGILTGVLAIVGARQIQAKQQDQVSPEAA